MKVQPSIWLIIYHVSKDHQDFSSGLHMSMWAAPSNLSDHYRLCMFPLTLTLNQLSLQLLCWRIIEETQGMGVKNYREGTADWCVASPGTSSITSPSLVVANVALPSLLGKGSACVYIALLNLMTQNDQSRHFPSIFASSHLSNLVTTIRLIRSVGIPNNTLSSARLYKS